jgi:hypothetical protein
MVVMVTTLKESQRIRELGNKTLRKIFGLK